MSRIGRPLQRIAGVLCVWSALVLTARAAPGERVERLNRAFLDHLATLEKDQPRAVEFVRKTWETDYRDSDAADSFVPDALALLYPGFREVLAAFDDGRFDDAARAADPLRKSADAFLAANADYYFARSLVERGQMEEAEAALVALSPQDAAHADRTPYAAHLWFLKAFAQASNLHFDLALRTLGQLRSDYADAPESVLVGARQLQLELERRTPESLDEVARLMGYAAARLHVRDREPRVRERQEEAIRLLDRLIQEMEQQEQQSGSGKGGARPGSGKKKSGTPQQPNAPAEESSAPDGGARIGDLHGAPKADPADMWGKLPAAEREKILQSLRERFPSRYRQLVEQYYRSLAEQK